MKLIRILLAAVNRLEVAKPSVWDPGPAWLGLLALWRDFIRSLRGLPR